MCLVIVKATNGPRYVVGCRRSIDKSKLVQGSRVALDMTTLTIMRYGKGHQRSELLFNRVESRFAEAS